MPRIKADIPTFLGSLNIEDFLDWVSETEKYFELMDIPEDSQVKYVAYKLRGATSSWWDNLQTRRRRQRKQPIRTWRKMKRVMFARFLPVDYEQTLYSLYCRQYSRTVSEYAEEFMRLASRNHSMYKTKTDTIQSSSSQSGGDAQVDHSKSTHEVDGGKKKTSTTTTSTHAINKSSINPYARPVGNKCFKCQEVGHTSNQCRATKRVNLAEGDKAHSESEDEGIIISPNVVFEDDDDDHSEAFLGLVRRLVLASTKKSENGRPWQSDLNVVHKIKENTYTFSKGGRKFTLCPYSDEVQATTTKERKNQIMLCSTRNKDKNICVTTIPPDQVLNPIRNSWSSSFQERENDGGLELEKRKKDDSRRNNLENKKSK
ncbi:gag-pol polyprotein-like protein [Tanacetum coccineum]|uniref:Gag-pol polyprotein-like protein n=1 Tax=Tanacetum coccineum TaxID=301880 RepID=A0ABQ4WBD9_9ASTR